MLHKLKEGHWPIFLLSSFSSVANLFLPIILTRLLSPEDIGTYKVFFLYLTLLPFLFLTGGPLHSVYYWVGKKEDKNDYLSAAFQLTTILSILILVIGLPLAGVLQKLFELSYTNTMVLLLVAMLWVPSSFYGQLKVALGETVYGSLFGTINELIKVILFITLAYLGYSVDDLFLAFLIYLSLKFLLTFGLNIKNQIKPFHLQKKKIREVLHYCTPIALAGLLSFFVDKMDQIVLTKFLAKDEFAFYTMGCLVIPPLYLLEMSVSKLLIPILSEHWQDDKKLCLSHFRKGVSDSALLLIPASFGLFIFAEPIVELLYTKTFSDSAQFLSLFAISYLTLIIPYDVVPRATGHTKWIFKMSVVLSPLSLIAILITSFYFGAYEVLICSIIFKFLYRIIALQYTCRLMEWNVIDTLPLRKIALFFMVSLILSMISYMMKQNFETRLSWFIVSGGSFFILYFVALIIPYRKGYLHDK